MRAVWRLSLAFALFGAVTVQAEDDAVGEVEAEDEEHEDGPTGMPEDDEDHEYGDYEQEAISPEAIRAMHAKIDSNKDGKASMAEVMAFSDMMRKKMASKDIRTILDEMDTDKDGTLSMDEFMKDMEQWNGPPSVPDEGSDDDDEMGAPAYEWTEEDKKEAEARKQLEKQKFQLADVSGDGKLSLEELPNLFYPETHDGVLGVVTESTMKAKDTNGDGKLTAKEFWSGDSPDPEMREQPISAEEEADFKKLDANGDGFIETSEMKLWESGKFHTQQAMQKMFELADKDKDGHVTAQELENAREQIAGSDAQYHLMEWAEHNEL
jgi:Ca2+-binding EF-hand superfamily protein